MKAMLCRIFTAALCVLLLAGCGTKAKTEDLRQSARETRSAGRQDVFDPPGTKRTQVQDPDITVSVQWAAGAEGDEAIRAVITEYFTLMATVLSAPDRTYEHAACCSDKALQELCLYGWMASTALYPEIRLQAAISRPVEYGAGNSQHGYGAALLPGYFPLLLYQRRQYGLCGLFRGPSADPFQGGWQMGR